MQNSGVSTIGPGKVVSMTKWLLHTKNKSKLRLILDITTQYILYLKQITIWDIWPLKVKVTWDVMSDPNKQ